MVVGSLMYWAVRIMSPVYLSYYQPFFCLLVHLFTYSSLFLSTLGTSSVSSQHQITRCADMQVLCIWELLHSCQRWILIESCHFIQHLFQGRCHMVVGSLMYWVVLICYQFIFLIICPSSCRPVRLFTISSFMYQVVLIMSPVDCLSKDLSFTSCACLSI